MTLTALKVTKTKKPGRYFDAHGLYLQVKESGAKSWLLRYEVHAVERWMGLGPLHTVTLAEARERARKARQLLLDGIDPLERRKADRAAAALEVVKAMTFEQAAQTYYDQHSDGWRNAKHRQRRTCLTQRDMAPAKASYYWLATCYPTTLNGVVFAPGG
jgi:hypothetical protein